MALKSTIYKVELSLSDMDRQVYGEHLLTLALHPSETEERLMVRLLAFALTVPADELNGRMVFAKGLADPDEPDLWHRNHADEIVHWVEVGHPDEKRMAKACSRADRATIMAYQASTPIWYAGIATRITRLRNLRILCLPPDQSQAWLHWPNARCVGQ